MSNRASAQSSVTLVTFATKKFESAREGLIESARPHSIIRSIERWTPQSLQEQYPEEVKEIDFSARGAGYWAWKPLIILDALRKQSEGGWVLYSDVGRGSGNRLPQTIEPLLSWASRNGGKIPGVYVPEVGPNKWWTKRSTFVLMGCDYGQYHEHPQVQATFSLWRKDHENELFLRKWLELCLDKRLISDNENVPGVKDLPGFIDHRHDQSILTNLCIKEGVSAFGLPHQRTEESKNIGSLVDRIQGIRRRQRVRLIMRRARYVVRTFPLLSGAYNHFRPMVNIERELLKRGKWL